MLQNVGADTELLTRCHTGILFAAFNVSKPVRALALQVLRERVRAFGLNVPDTLDHRQVKELYLWHFGQPKSLVRKSLSEDCDLPALTSRGVCFLKNGAEFKGICEERFSRKKSEIAIGNMPKGFNQLQLTVCQHNGIDLALIRGTPTRLIRLDSQQEIDLGGAHALTVDSPDNAQRIAVLLGKDNQWTISWCDLAGLLAGEAGWRKFTIPSGGELELLACYFLDWWKDCIAVVKHDYEGRQRYLAGKFNLELGQWDPPKDANVTTPYMPPPRSLLHQHMLGIPSQPGSSLLLQDIDVAAVSCGQFRLQCSADASTGLAVHLFDNPPNSIPFPVRSIQGLGNLEKLRAFRATAFCGYPFVFAAPYRSIGNGRRLDFRVWRLEAPTGAFADLELGQVSLAQDQKILVDHWAETLLQRALRLGLPDDKILSLIQHAWALLKEDEDLADFFEEHLLTAVRTNKLERLQLFFHPDALPAGALKGETVRRAFVEACELGFEEELLFLAEQLNWGGAMPMPDDHPENWPVVDGWLPIWGMGWLAKGGQWRLIPKLAAAVPRLASTEQRPFYGAVVNRILQFLRGDALNHPDVPVMVEALLKAAPYLAENEQFLQLLDQIGKPEILQKVKKAKSDD